MCIRDSSGESSAEVTVSITVNDPAPGNTAPVAVGDSLTAEIGETVTVLDGGLLSVLANDTDADGDQLTAVLENVPLHGSLTLESDGTFVYGHDGSAGTADSFSYRAEDTSGESSVVVTVSITVNSDGGTPTDTDFDGDGIANATDTDDDGDGIVDEQDAFALDGTNGLGSPAMLALEFDGSDSEAVSYTHLTLPTILLV